MSQNKVRGGEETWWPRGHEPTEGADRPHLLLYGGLRGASEGGVEGLDVWMDPTLFPRRAPSTARSVALKHVQDTQPTFVVVVPAPRVVVLQDLRGPPGLQNVVHLVLLSPSQGLTQDLSGFVDIEVPGT